MKNRAYGIANKSVAFVLFLIFVLTAFLSLLGVAYMARDGYYSSGYSFYDTELCARETRQYADKVIYDYYPLTTHQLTNSDDRYKLLQYKSEFSEENTNFFFELTSLSSDDLLKNYNNQSYGFKHSYSYKYASYTCMITCYVRDPISAQDNYMRVYELYQTLYAARYPAIILTCVSIPIAIGLFVFLMYAAGKRKNSSELITTWQHAIPFEFLAGGLIIAGYLTVRLLADLNSSIGYEFGFLILLPGSLLLFAFAAFSLIFCMNFAVRIKKGKWFRNTIIYRVLNCATKVIKQLYKILPMVWKAALMIACYLIVNVFICAIFIGTGGSTFGGFIWLLFNFAVFAALCFLLLQLKMLKRAGERIAEGDYSGRIETDKMLWEIKQHAESLNNIGAGMSKAVDARMKSERLKTELITNVSHDLKTPLTSIITYIDLLKKETLKNEKAEEYIGVLDRQSIRLKKLTDDLLEASKAATGNTLVSFERTDLVELINQSTGEYTERFDACHLEFIFSTNRETAAIYADGKLLWRVFDNLLNNICKYSLAGTRVYISVDINDDITKITFLNISNCPLNVAADELQERFVRGDASRSTDGSGLGLSIAKNLTELQNGSFCLFVEGDMFKTVITFKSML